MRVLHVTESYVGAGVSRVIESIVSATPEIEHHLLWAGDTNVARASAHMYEALYELPLGQVSRIRRTRNIVAAVRPDVVHAHSSWAGLYTRAMRVGAPVVYQPHCYKFDDAEEHALLRGIYRGAERAMTRRTAITIALCEHERVLAKGLSTRNRVAVVPNTPTVSVEHRPIHRHLEIPITHVVMIGRVCSQKDPSFYSAVSRLVARSAPEISFRWIGDGDLHRISELRDSGVEVTGWLPPRRMRTHLLEGALYFHSARYEGFPVSVLDAAAIGAPVVVRDIPAFQGVNLRQFDTVESAAEGIVELSRRPDLLAEARERTMELLNVMNPTEQRRALDGVYTHFSGVPA